MVLRKIIWIGAPDRCSLRWRSEREMMLERQREGIAKAKGRGLVPRPQAKADDAVRLFRDCKRAAHIAKELGIGRGSVYRALEAAGLFAA